MYIVSKMSNHELQTTVGQDLKACTVYSDLSTYTFTSTIGPDYTNVLFEGRMSSYNVVKQCTDCVCVRACVRACVCACVIA